MKKTAEGIEELLKAFTPKKIISMYYTNEINLTSKELDYLFELRDGKKKEKNKEVGNDK